jgi:cytochrome P450
MMLYPEVQRKAQEEIDKVIGNDRLPTMADQASLPYLGAVVKEVLRWNPVTPLCKFLLFFQVISREVNCLGPASNPTHRHRRRLL